MYVSRPSASVNFIVQTGLKSKSNIVNEYYFYFNQENSVKSYSFSFAVIVGEIANFFAYGFAPAILVTPLGALSIIFRFSLFYISLS